MSIPSGAVSKVVNGKTHAHEDTKVKFVWNSIEKLNKINKIIISMDNDTAGNAMAEELARRIGKHKCYKIKYPDDARMQRGASPSRERIFI